MPDIRRLLVAVDLELGGRSQTQGSETAADQAFEPATRLGSEVLLLHSTASDEVWDVEQRAMSRFRKRSRRSACRCSTRWSLPHDRDRDHGGDDG